MHTRGSVVLPALAAVRADDFDEALKHLIHAWRCGHHPRVADAIEAVDARVKAGRELLAPGTSRHAAWLARAEAGDPRDLAVLLADIVAPRAHLSRARLEAIADRDDPRLLRLLQHHLAEKPWRGARTGDGYARRAIAILADSRSREAHDVLRRQAERNRGSLKPHGLYVARALRDAARHLERAPEPTIGDDAERGCQEIIERAAETVDAGTARTVEALFAAVHADPEDLGARAVLADVLVEAGDPRGEFIALQLGRDPAARPSKRERTLLGQYQRTWLADIEGFAARNGHVWRGGFPHRLRVGRRSVLESELELDLWRTVGELDVGLYGWAVSAIPLLFSPQMCSLRSVWGLSAGQLYQIRDERRAVPWRAMGGFRYATFDGLTEALVALDAPALHHLDVSAEPYRPTPQWVERVAAALPIQRLDVQAPDAPWSTFYGFPAGLREVWLFSEKGGKSWGARLVRGASAIELHYGGGARQAVPAASLARWLRGQTPGPFRALRLVPSRKLAKGQDWRVVAQQATLQGFALEGFE